jgi:hypothetical protein
MKKQQSTSTRSIHQSVAPKFELKTGSKSIAIEFTNQRLSPHAGTTAFWGWAHSINVPQKLKAALPHPLPRSNNSLLPHEKALGFVQGIICDGRKLTHCSHLRHDPMVPEVLDIKRVASQSSFTRFFKGFDSAASNSQCFRSLFRFCMDQLPSADGYTLDLDSTRLLHRDGHQEGVAGGYTKEGIKPCLHPLLGVLGEARMVAQFWLRPGNTNCSNNAVAFINELFSNLPSHIRIKAVRADSGFSSHEILSLLEEKGLPYMVVVKFRKPLAQLATKHTKWIRVLPGVEVADVEYEFAKSGTPRRVVLVRQEEKEDRKGGKYLLDVPGYTYQAVMTNLPASTHSPLQIWSRYNDRADCENVVKELQQGFAIKHLCLEKFYATEGALGLATFAYNLVLLFQRHLGWRTRATLETVRRWLFVTAGSISRPAGKTTIKLAVPKSSRKWWIDTWEKILSILPNCNSVEERPGFG